MQSSQAPKLFVTVMVTAQPFFIPGLDMEKAPGSALGALYMFIFTFFLSAYGIYYDNQRKADELDAPNGYQLSSAGAPAEYGSRYD